MAAPSPNTFVVFLLGILVSSPIIQTVNAGKVVFAHMVNTPHAVRWGLNQGANGVEMDLRFNGNVPDKFQHSSNSFGACDCTCLCPILSSAVCSTTNVCKTLWLETGSTCTAHSSAEDMTIALGGADVRPKLAVIYIDSKLSSDIADLHGAGSNIVKMLNRNVFDRGYQGQVIINGANIIYAEYLRGALQAALASNYASKYFYTFDFESQDSYNTWAALIRLGTNNIVYSTGISSCASGDFINVIKRSAAKNQFAGIGIWTLDSTTSMRNYVAAGADSIMTNFPRDAVGVFGASNLASPGNALVAKTVPNPPPPTGGCDCDYHRGGCSISSTAPLYGACYCTYKGAWTCGGKTVDCVDWNNAKCRNPDRSIDSCRQGGGDCKGY